MRELWFRAKYVNKKLYFYLIPIERLLSAHAKVGLVEKATYSGLCDVWLCKRQS
jgi:hypothetical protein